MNFCRTSNSTFPVWMRSRNARATTAFDSCRQHPRAARARTARHLLRVLRNVVIHRRPPTCRVSKDCLRRDCTSPTRLTRTPPDGPLTLLWFRVNRWVNAYRPSSTTGFSEFVSLSFHSNFNDFNRVCYIYRKGQRESWS